MNERKNRLIQMGGLTERPTYKWEDGLDAQMAKLMEKQILLYMHGQIYAERHMKTNTDV